MNYQLSSLTTAQLRHAADLKEKIEALTKELAALLGAPASAPTARRTKVQPLKSVTKSAAKAPAKKSGMSPAAKAKLSAIAKARWAKIKAAGNKSL